MTIGNVPRWARSLPSIVLARRIRPAQVARTGKPSLMSCWIGLSKLSCLKSLPWTVLSPPGRISPSMPSRSFNCLISTTSAPKSWIIFSCSIKAHCKANMPTFIFIVLFLP